MCLCTGTISITYASELKTSRALGMKDICDPTRKFEKSPFLNMHSVLFINKTVLKNVQMGDNNSYCKCRTGYSKLTDKLPTVCIQSNTLKGQCHEIFDFWFFFMNQFPPIPWVYHEGRFEFFRKFAEIFAAKGLPPVSTPPVANAKNLQS